MPKILLVGSLLLFGLAWRPNAAVAQRTLVIENTNQPGAIVFVDSAIVGRVAERFFRLSHDAERVVVAPSVPGSWSIPPIQFQLSRLGSYTDSDTIAVDAVFPYYYSVRTTPPGARVFTDRNKTNIGYTPLVFSRSAPIADSLRLELDGYSSVSLRPGHGLWNPVDVAMSANGTVDLGFVARPPKRSKRWVNVLAVSLVALGGGAAVHYKFKADRRFRIYEQTGDPALRPEVHRLDVRSGVALGVMQSGVAILVIRLVRR